MTTSTHLFILPILPIIFLLSIAIPTLLLSLLQLFLCRKNLCWGRILPIFSITVSILILVFLFILFFTLQLSAEPWWVVPLIALLILIILNIPTLIYYLIYHSEKKRQIAENVNRTRINDLE